MINHMNQSSAVVKIQIPDGLPPRSISDNAIPNNLISAVH